MCSKLHGLANQSYPSYYKAHMNRTGESLWGYSNHRRLLKLQRLQCHCARACLRHNCGGPCLLLLLEMLLKLLLLLLLKLLQCYCLLPEQLHLPLCHCFPRLHCSCKNEDIVEGILNN